MSIINTALDATGLGPYVRTIKLVVIALIVLATGGSFYYLYSRNKTLEFELEKAKSDLQLTIAANKHADEAIKQLQNEKTTSEKERADLKIQIFRDKKQIDNLKSIIIASPESENGTIAPVLKKTIDGIQILRAAREVK